MSKFTRGQLVVGPNPCCVYVVVDFDRALLVVRPVNLGANVELLYSLAHSVMKPATREHLDRIR